MKRTVTLIPGTYIDEFLKNNLDKMRTAVRKKDTDFLIIIDGHTGSGKSTLAFQLAKYLDETFNLKDIAFDSNTFYRLLRTSEKYKAIVFDEATRGLYSKEGMTKFNILLEKQVNEVRQRNLFIIVVLPSVFYLSKLFALDRASVLLHAFTGDDYQRGMAAWYSPRLIKDLFIKGQRFLDHGKVKPDTIIHFSGRYDVPEEEYRQLKLKAFQEIYKDTAEDKPKDQVFYKNTRLLIRLLSLLDYCHNNLKLTKKEIAEGMSKLNVVKLQEGTVTSDLSYIPALKEWLLEKKLSHRSNAIGLTGIDVEKLKEETEETII